MDESKLKKYNYYEDNKKKVQIKNGSKLKLRQWVTKLTNLITIDATERTKNRELIIEAYNVGGLKLVSEYASKRIVENDTIKFNNLLSYYNVSDELFKKIIQLDKLTKKEILDIDYVEDRLIAHEEFIKQYNIDNN